jgi:hypothetical protein
MKMIRTFKELIEKVKAGEPQKKSVAVAQDKDALASGVFRVLENKENLQKYPNIL